MSRSLLSSLVVCSLLSSAGLAASLAPRIAAAVEPTLIFSVNNS